MHMIIIIERIIMILFKIKHSYLLINHSFIQMTQSVSSLTIIVEEKKKKKKLIYYCLINSLNVYLNGVHEQKVSE